METSDEDRKINGHDHDHDHQDEQNPSKRKKGGLITMPFIIANESFEKVASYGLLPNMILYLIKDYKMTVKGGTNVLYFWQAATNFLPVVGAFLADSYLGRFLTIGIGAIISLFGMFLLWLTTVIPSAKPPPCNPLANNCKTPTGGQYTLLFSAFLFMSIGAGGVRPCSQAFGADQIDQRDNPKNRKILETFFGWYYACACLAVVLALTVIVYIQDHLGWRIGFGIPAILMFLSALSFFLASPFYVKHKVERSLFSSLVKVAVAAFRNRKTQLPIRKSEVQYYYQKDSKFTVPSPRFLNKACIIRDPDQDIGPDGLARNPWKLCSVEEVEELKALIRVIPMWSSGIMMSVTTSSGGSYGLLIAKSMNRHIGKNFEIPAGSFGTFLVIVIVIWIPLYDRVIIPLASKVRGKPVHLGVKLRMGIGLFISALGVLVSGIVEHIRRRRAINEGFADNPNGLIHMSAMWLLLSQIFGGLAESFNAIGQTEFFYTEFPKSMSSIATCLFGVGMGLASLIASVIFNLVDSITQRGGKQSWVANNINRAHYDYYYWLMAFLSFLNVFYFLFCSWLYGPVIDKRNKVVDEQESTVGVEEELAMLRNTSRHVKGDLKDDYSFSKTNEIAV